MSHFVVLVIGDNVDQQLAPFNEQPEDGYHSNPKAKWDWYQIGGRWSGYFKALPGSIGIVGESGVFGNKAKPGMYDQLQRGSIDFEGMRADAAAEASKRYDAYEAAVAGLEVPKRWAEFRTAYENIDDARKAFSELPYITALRTANLMPWFEDPVEVYGIGREKFVERASSGSFTPYAVLKDGEWFAKGEMGWFGMSSDDVDPETWNDRVWELLRDLPEDTLITAVDCHI